MGYRIVSAELPSFRCGPSRSFYYLSVAKRSTYRISSPPNPISIPPVFNHLQKSTSETPTLVSYSPAMATEAQNEANRQNAQASTGPKTPEGKLTSSRNAVSHGLFSTAGTPAPEEQNEFTELSAAMQQDLAPEGILEQTLTGEITRAAWRLRRCAAVEDSLVEADPFTDAMSSASTSKTQIAVDRARLQTHRILTRCMTELRRLQNERRFRIEILPPGFNTAELGLASYKDLMPAMVAEKRWQLQKRKLEGLGSFESMLEAATAPPQSSPAKQTQSAPVFTPRNAPCPCGSNEKYKRCCGKNAPPLLMTGAPVKAAA